MGVGGVNRGVVGDCHGEMLAVRSGDRRVRRHMGRRVDRGGGEYRRGEFGGIRGGLSLVEWLVSGLWVPSTRFAGRGPSGFLVLRSIN